MIGFVNTAHGHHSGAQLGFVNTNLKNFKGLQASFVNTTLGDFIGAQLGYINTNKGNTQGLQMGFVNTTGGAFNGAQIGFMNTTAKKLQGSQIGFINYADSISGVPIGFLSIVKKGAYRALEYSVSDLYPFNFSFKIGVPYFYTIIQGSYHFDYFQKFALGLGWGSLIPVAQKWYFNPEITNLTTLTNDINNVSTLGLNMRYRAHQRLDVFAGLTGSWINYPENQNNFCSTLYSFVNHKVNDRNSFTLGARAGISVNLSK